MARITRGEFLGFGAALAGAVVAPRSAAEAAAARPPAQTPGVANGPGVEADLVVVNARVYTVDPAMPRAEAFAVKHGRFIAVGSSADIRNLATARTQVIDAAGQTVTPGFIDTHCHVSGVDELYSVNANVTQVRRLQAAIAEKARTTPPGFWIDAFMFDDTKLDVELTRKHLDEVGGDHPVVVRHRGGHTSWYNTKAFELAGIGKDTRDPEHGRFFRDASGELTGRVAELARNAFATVGRRETFTPAEMRDRGRNGMRHISGLLTAAGLTSVHDASAGRNRILAYEDAKRHGELRHRAAFLAANGDTFSGFKAAGITYGFGDEFLRVIGVKYAADGSASERTMRMSTPYVGTEDYGILTMTQEDIDEAVEDAHTHDFRIAIHCQRRRHHRHGPQGLRGGGEEASAAGHAAPHRALLAGQPRPAGPHQGRRRHPHAVLDLRPLPRREVGAVRGREDALDVRAQVVPRLRHPRAGRVGL
jgi:predicted amidohydrolase YtcJ